MAAFSRVQELLATVGIGACTPTIVPASHLVGRNDTLRGEVRVRGGEAAQELTRAKVELLVTYTGDYDDRTTTEQFAAAEVLIAQRIGPGKMIAVPFELVIPDTVPAIATATPVSLRSQVRVGFGLGRSTQVPVTVLPRAEERAVGVALRALGLQLAGSRCVVPPRALPGQEAPFVQECFWRVPEGRWPGVMDVTTVLLPHGQALNLFIEVNREARGYDLYVGPSYTVEQRYRQVTLPQAALDPSTIAAFLDSALQCCPRPARGQASSEL